MYKRPQYQVLLERVKEPRRFIQAIAGPRQVGKSTMVKQVLQDCGIPYIIDSADGVDANDSGWISDLGNLRGHACGLLVKRNFFS